MRGNGGSLLKRRRIDVYPSHFSRLFLFRLMAFEGGEDWLMAYGAVKNSINTNARVNMNGWNGKCQMAMAKKRGKGGFFWRKLDGWLRSNCDCTKWSKI
jgi:hypothetical protein